MMTSMIEKTWMTSFQIKKKRKQKMKKNKILILTNQVLTILKDILA
jgi:hypothetical protein